MTISIQNRQFVATALGIVTLLCAACLYLTYGYVIWHGVPEVDDGPLVVFAVWILTATPAIVCTLFALALVGHERSKLAWVSLCMYPLLPVVAFIISLCAMHH